MHYSPLSTFVRLIHPTQEVVIKLLSLRLPLLIERIYISYGASLTEELDIQSYWHPLSTWVGRHPKLRFAKIPGWGVWERGDSHAFLSERLICASY
jgi:hypothetical protein